MQCVIPYYVQCTYIFRGERSLGKPIVLYRDSMQSRFFFNDGNDKNKIGKT